MKPLLLVLEAFGSYGSKTAIDFTKVRQNIFLISGDTGSGKSTIYDGIVFALYGEASSNENKKEGEVLQSQFASIDVKPCVTFTFEEEGEKYTVVRNPRHFKKVTRGKNAGSLTLESEKLELTLSDGTVLVQAQAQKKIEELVKLTKEQFMQVVMLAQGEFMDVLRATTQEKKEIFRKLFHTEKYANVVNKLAERKKDLENNVELLRSTTNASIAQLDLSEASDALKESYEQLSQGTFSVLRKFVDLLKEYCDEENKKLEEKKQEFNDCNLAYQNGQKVLQQAEQLLVYYQRLEEVNKQLEELSATQERYQENKEVLKKIQVAYQLSPLYTRYAENNRSYQVSVKEYERAKESLPTVEKQYKEAKTKLAQHTSSLNEEISSYTRTQESIKGAKESLISCKTYSETLQAKKVKELQAIKRFQDIEKSISLNEQERKLVGQTIQDTQSCVNALAELKIQHEKFQNISKQYTSYLQQVENKKQVHLQYQNKWKLYSSLKQTYTQASAMYDKNFEAYIDNQAGFIAQQLEEGKPCPVCGAIHHPFVAKVDKEVDINRETLDYLKKQRDKAQVEVEASANEVQTYKTKEEELNKQVETLYRSLQDTLQCEDVDIVLKEEKEKLVVIEKKVNADKERYDKALERKNKLENERENLLKRKEVGTQYLHTIKEEIAVLTQQVKDAKTKCLYSSLEEADIVLQQAKSKYEEVKKTHDSLERSKVQAQNAYAKGKSEVENGEKKLPQLKEEVQGLKQAYEEALHQSGLQENWQSLLKLPKESIEKSVKEYEEKLTSLTSSKEEYTRLVKDSSYPDIQALQEKLRVIEDKWKILQQEQSALQVRISKNDSIYPHLVDSCSNLDTIIKTLGHVTKLYNLMSGKVTNGRMDIETYVQRYYLEQILTYANRRFYTMTAGQFELHLMKLDNAGIGKNKGLDLMVYSYATNTEREIRTLSGGESFMAALTLALGMADQIQQNTSAIHLDMLFIDEGFGSLDDTSRTQAIQVLKDLASDNKLIGIISHVTELKTQLETQLLVEKKEDGSHISWKIS